MRSAETSGRLAPRSDDRTFTSSVTPLGQPRVPAQCPRGRDKRHEVAALRLVVQELLDGLLRALALILRQVHVVEEDDERSALVRLYADVRRIARRPRAGRSGCAACAAITG